jgi:hypothetical protein
MTYLAEEDSRTALDYLFIFELSFLFREEGGFVLKDWISLDTIAKIARGMNNDNRYVLECIYMMEGSPEWVDPFSYDRYFNKKLHIFIDSLCKKLPSTSSLPKEVNQESGDELMGYIKNISIVIQNFITLSRWSKVDSQDYTHYYSPKK